MLSDITDSLTLRDVRSLSVALVNFTYTTDEFSFVVYLWIMLEKERYIKNYILTL